MSDADRKLPIFPEFPEQPELQVVPVPEEKQPSVILIIGIPLEEDELPGGTLINIKPVNNTYH